VRLDTGAALRFVESLRTAPASYRMAPGVEGTLFTDLFAFFVHHLAGLPRDEETKVLEGRLRESQDPQTGLWSTADRRGGSHGMHTPEFVDLQLTTFALAALTALGASPVHRLRRLEEWRTPEAVRAYLDRQPWALNPWHSGNRAMLLGSLLAWDVRCGRGDDAASLLEAWFDWHDRAARPESGFWGEGHRADWHVGMGGAAHQYVIYDYCGRRPPHLERAVARTLRLQYADGRFWPVAGGGSCYELDAMQVLRVGHRHLPESRGPIEVAAGKVIDVLLSSANADGGLCWARRRWFDVPDLLRNLTVTGDPRTMLWSLRAQASAHVLRSREVRATAWAQDSHGVGHSSLFDTWFRLLTAAEIYAVTGDPRVEAPWQPLPAANWGFF
jgi:hypothetical protein